MSDGIKSNCNREGLTWVEWAAAAGYDTDTWNDPFKVSAELYTDLRTAWRDAEDPSEWRAKTPKRA